MFGPLALLVVATGLFAAAVVRRWARRPRPGAPRRFDLEQVQGFVLVGSGAVVLLGVAVLVLGLSGREGEAEAMAVLGLIAYLVYLLLAVLIIRRTARRTAPHADPRTAHLAGRRTARRSVDRGSRRADPPGVSDPT